MPEGIVTKKKGPELNDTGGPIWFFWKGRKFDYMDRRKGGLYLGASAVSIFIKSHPKASDRWILTWEVHHLVDCFSKGSVVVDTRTLLLVFGSSEQHVNVRIHDELTERVGADFFIPGVACRWNEYVTLPNIGTGIAYDSNVSIVITPEIQEAVAKLVSDVQARKPSRHTQV